MKTIGVITIDPWTAFDDKSLMHDLFYFDELVYTLSAKSLMKKFCTISPDFEENFKRNLIAIDKLENAGLISEYPSDKLRKDVLKNNDEKTFRLFEKSIKISKDYLSSETPKRIGIKFFGNFLDGAREQAQLDSRIKSIILNKNSNNKYSPIFKSIYKDSRYLSKESNSTVLNVIMKKFPNISKNVELERFIEYKQDPETILKLSRLRNWVLEISQKSFTHKEIEQKIDFLLNEYSSQLELHKLKYEMNTLQTLVVTSLEILENVLQLKFSKAAKVIFDLKKQDILLLEAERKITGNSMAIIYDSNNKNSL
jgi:hypothetical protein